jgi:uncharacterized protein YlxW (UPF0749 family)
VFAVAGALFATSAVTSGSSDLRTDSTGGLRDAISSRAQYASTLASEVSGLSATVDHLRATSDPGPELAKTLKQIADLSATVGLTEVKGPGVTVALNDATPPDPMPEGMSGDDYIVHQQDIQGVVNAFWRGGASGVTVMGQRLIATSAVRCVGNTVILQGRVYSPPFVISAVGNVASLERELANDPAVSLFRQWSDLVGLGYSQTVSAALTLPAYSGPLTLTYANVLP